MVSNSSSVSLPGFHEDVIGDGDLSEVVQRRGFA
jgi:hypothetical protein